MTTEQIRSPARCLEMAIEHHRAARLTEAELLCREVLNADPAQFDALHLLGVLAIQRRKYQEAIDLISQALAVQPSNVEALRNLGEAYRGLNYLDEAEVCLERALRIKPDDAEAYNGLGHVQAQRERTDAAIACYRKAISIDPGCVDAHVNLGNRFLDLGNWNEAATCFETALALRPNLVGAHCGLASVHKALRKLDEAIATYRKALTFEPDHPETHAALGRALQEVGERDEALASFQRALSLQPERADARWAVVFAELAAVHARGENPQQFRQAFAHGLDELDQWFNADRIGAGFDAVGSQQPFYLAYQEQNNRDLLARYGRLCNRLARHWQDEQRLVAPKPKRGPRIRVGIVSDHFRSHAVWYGLLKGWLARLDQQRFELHLFSTGGGQDAVTAFARSRAARFEEGRRGLGLWAEAIVASQLHALIYPEIGMDPVTAKLANLRLAPVQATTWGHPETSGFPTIDYYLSAADFEPEAAQDNYTEQLVLLPHLGSCCSPITADAAELSLGELGVDTSVPLFVCAGTPFKYAPQHDRVYVEIARRLGSCQFIFFRFDRQGLSDRLIQRLAAAFAQAGLDFNRFGVVAPMLDLGRFHSLMRQSDVLLDTIGFSGFNTAMQAVECGLPIVTREGKFMRGRFASAILRRLGLPELVASSEQNYVDLAVELARDRARRLSLHERIGASRHLVFDDVVPIRVLEEFLVKVAKR